MKRAKNGKPTMPSIGPPSFFSNAFEIACTVGWSMTMAVRSFTATSPTCNSFTLTSPLEPKILNSGSGTSLSSPAASATLLSMSVIGAPVSRMSRYGPSPLTLTMTVMWPLGSSSNGTTTDLGAAPVLGASARTGVVRQTRASAKRSRFMVTGPPRS